MSFLCIVSLRMFGLSHRENEQDDHGDLSSVNMDTAVAIRTLEATYKSSADAAAVEAMIIKLTEKVYCRYISVHHSSILLRFALCSRALSCLVFCNFIFYPYFIYLHKKNYFINPYVRYFHCSCVSRNIQPKVLSL